MLHAVGACADLTSTHHKPSVLLCRTAGEKYGFSLKVRGCELGRCAFRHMGGFAGGLDAWVLTAMSLCARLQARKPEVVDLAHVRVFLLYVCMPALLLCRLPLLHPAPPMHIIVPDWKVVALGWGILAGLCRCAPSGGRRARRGGRGRAGGRACSSRRGRVCPNRRGSASRRGRASSLRRRPRVSAHAMVAPCKTSSPRLGTSMDCGACSFASCPHHHWFLTDAFSKCNLLTFCYRGCGCGCTNAVHHVLTVLRRQKQVLTCTHEQWAEGDPLETMQASGAI